MSNFSAKGLSILVSIPLVMGNDVVGDYTNIVNSYSHTISARGGFTSASFSLTGNNEFLEDWLQNGLGRHIQVFGPQQQLIWEGFVDDFTINMGGASFSRGPLTGIVNRISAMYTPIYDCENVPPSEPACEEGQTTITGTPLPTHIYDDLASIERYGIWEKVITLSEMKRDEAELITQMYLTDNCMPEGNPSVSIGSEGDLSVSVNCKGYMEWMAYVYNYTTDEESHEISDIIMAILAEDPNDIISTLYDRIEDNPTIAMQFTEDNKLARNIIDDLVSYGGGNSDRWTFGIYGNRKVVYAPIPTVVEYLYYKTGKTQQVETVSGKIVEPWDVSPCKWVAIPTFLTSFGIRVGDINNDPRVFFAEEVSYTAPDQVTISGAKIRKLDQYLASNGYGGV